MSESGLGKRIGAGAVVAGARNIAYCSGTSVRSCRQRL